jgi:hypothetical protein
LAIAFNEAMETQDQGALSKIGALLSEMPEAQQFIQPGKGWEGKFHSAEDKVSAMDELETASDMSYSQRLFHKAAIKKAGIIPQPVPEPDRFLEWKSNKGEEPRI